jgi:purine-nucleoside phosphorylase
MLKKINEAVSYLKEQFPEIPESGIILGSGLGNFVNEINVLKTIPYESIPHFPRSTVLGHQGNLILGKSEKNLVLAMQGRPHYYEGITVSEVIFPVRVMHFLGVRNIFVSNACGGLNPSFEIGDLMIITDHINLMPNPLIGEHHPEFGERFPDMSEPYDQQLIQEAFQISERNGFNIKMGVYIGLTGPTLETPAEYKYLRIIGGDAVGMSTVPEIIAANQMGMRCFGISVITDLGVPGKIEKVTHQDVLEAARKVEPKLATLIKDLVNIASSD